jgi:uncharacterized protein
MAQIAGSQETIMSPNSISSVDGLRQIYPSPPANSLAIRCVLPRLDRHHCAFIALSPFLMVASVDRHGSPDVSPRGDRPGFVAVLDAQTLVIPDRPGNKKLLTLTNILAKPEVSLIFLVPGRTESVRVRGTAQLTTDPDLLASLAVDGKTPLSGLIVSVTRAWLHCGRALIRSRLWEPDAQVGRDALPSLGRMLSDQIAGVDAADAESRLERANGELLWGEPTS